MCEDVEYLWIPLSGGDTAHRNSQFGYSQDLPIVLSDSRAAFLRPAVITLTS